jgi:hypothetical protein
VDFSKEEYRAWVDRREGRSQGDDEGRYTQADVDANIARMEEEKREDEARREKESMKAAYIADGGTAKQFEQEYEALQREARRRRILSRDERAREDMRASGVSSL